MPGKYDFPGIKKVGTAALKAVLTGTQWGAWILNSPFKPLFELILGHLIEWFANKGLIIINLGAIIVEGEVDQSKFDLALDDAIKKAKMPGLTDQEKEKIDNEVIEAFRKFARLNSKPLKP